MMLVVGSWVTVRKVMSLVSLAGAIALGSVLPAEAISLGLASDYNAFIFEDMNQWNSDAEGRIAVGGNATFQNYGVASRLPNSSGLDNRLVVGGNLTFTNGQINGGNAVYGGTAKLTNVGIPNGQLLQGNPLDFAAAVQDLTNLSSYLGGLSATGSTTYHSWRGIELVGSGTGLNVFNVDASKLSSAVNLRIVADPNATVLINVVGASANLQNFGINLVGVSEADILYNFADATQLSSSGFSFMGSVLAPHAAYNFNNGNLEGTLIARSVTGTGEYHYNPFTGNLPAPPAAAVPEPTTGAGIALAVAGLTWLRRRSQPQKLS